MFLNWGENESLGLVLQDGGLRNVIQMPGHQSFNLLLGTILKKWKGKKGAKSPLKIHMTIEADVRPPVASHGLSSRFN
jgi:hypothetical protein